MKRPLNFDILLYFTAAEEGSAEDVLSALKESHGGERIFTKKKVEEVLMTAEKNGLLQESRLALDEEGKLLIYYRADEGQRKMISSFIRS